MKTRALFAAVLAFGLLTGACGTSGSDGIVVDDPWGRSSPMVANNGAFYMTIEGSDVDDRLVSAYASVCGTTELHQTIVTDGVMSMQQAEGGIEIPAGGEAVLAPGGYQPYLLEGEQMAPILLVLLSLVAAMVVVIDLPTDNNNSTVK